MDKSEQPSEMGPRASGRGRRRKRSCMQVEGGLELRYNPSSGNFWMDEDAVFVFTVEALLSMFDRREKVFDSGAHTISFQSGEGLGASAIRQLLSRNMEKRSILMLFDDYGSRWGFGHYSLKELKEEPEFQIVFELYNMPMFDKATGTPSFMFFLKGYYSGFFKGLLGKNVIVEQSALKSKKAVRFQVTQTEHTS